MYVEPADVVGRANRRLTRSNISRVETLWKGRLAQAAVRYGEFAATATTCCNACRTCVQTNLLTAALSTVAGAVAFLSRGVARRTAHG
jgi:hypothetical protein